jgi:hypothetical protein
MAGNYRCADWVIHLHTFPKFTKHLCRRGGCLLNAAPSPILQALKRHMRCWYACFKCTRLLGVIVGLVLTRLAASGLASSPPQRTLPNRSCHVARSWCARDLKPSRVMRFALRLIFQPGYPFFGTHPHRLLRPGRLRPPREPEERLSRPRLACDQGGGSTSFGGRGSDRPSPATCHRPRPRHRPGRACSPANRARRGPGPLGRTQPVPA